MRQVSEAERLKMLKICENQYIMANNSLKETLKELRKKFNPDGTRQYSDEEIESVDSVILIRNGILDIEALFGIETHTHFRHLSARSITYQQIRCIGNHFQSYL